MKDVLGDGIKGGNAQQSNYNNRDEFHSRPNFCKSISHDINDGIIQLYDEITYDLPRYVHDIVPDSSSSFTHHTRVKNNNVFLLGASLRRKTLLKYSNLSEEDRSNTNRWTSYCFDAHFFPSSFSKNNEARKEDSTHVDGKFTNQTEIEKGAKNDDKLFSYMQQHHPVKIIKNDMIDTMKSTREKAGRKGRHHKAQN